MKGKGSKRIIKGKNQKVRRLSIRFKLLVPVVIVLLAVCSLLSMFAYMTVETEMTAMGQMQAQTVASLAETNLDAVAIAQLKKPGMENTDLYKSQQKVLIDVHEKGNVLYIYTLYILYMAEMRRSVSSTGSKDGVPPPKYMESTGKGYFAEASLISFKRAEK